MNIKFESKIVSLIIVSLLFLDSAATADLWVMEDGKVGIGTANPVVQLHVESSNVFAIYARSTAPGKYGIQGVGEARGVFGEGRTPNGYGVYGLAVNGYGVQGYGGAVGVVGCGSTSNSYDFYAIGPGPDYVTSSSKRWKKNIKKIDSSLDKVMGIRGVKFKWDETHGGRDDIGFIAEEMAMIIPEIVAYDENGTTPVGVDYGAITPILVEAIKELRAEKNSEIAALQEQNEELKSALCKLHPKLKLCGK